MDPQNTEMQEYVEQTSADQTGSGVVNPNDNAGAYYGDYSQEIYQYLLTHDIGGHFDSIDENTAKTSNNISYILIAVVFFIFLFFTFKFIRQKGLDL